MANKDITLSLQASGGQLEDDIFTLVETTSGKYAFPVSATIAGGTAFPASLGQKASAASFPVVLSTEQEAEIGIVTETAPATDTASSGLNGRLQRIAQRLTTMIANIGATTDAAVITDANGSVIAFLRGLVKLLGIQLPATLGQKTAAASLAVVVASDQGALGTVAPTLGTGTVATAPSVTTSATVLKAANATRKALVIVNNDAAAVLYIGPTSGVTTANGLPIKAGLSFTDSSSNAGWWGIAASGTIDTRVVETS